MSDPLSNTGQQQQPPQINTLGIGGGFTNNKANSVGTPYTTPLQQTPSVGGINSLSANNSPITSNMVNNNSSNNLSGMATQQNNSNIAPSASTNNLSGLVSNNTPGSTTTITTPSSVSVVSQSRHVSASCFEFFYIEMVDYIMKSSSDKTQAHKKLDKLGFKVGHRLVERLSFDTALFPELLDAVKFICKVFWLSVFKKTIDGLKTNHKGVFVLTDNKFQWLQHLSFDSSSSSKDCSEYVQFTAGLIKGAMSNFGYKCIVTFDIQQVSQCVFTIKIES